MPAWPTFPIPYSVSPPGLIDPVLEMIVDQGYSIRRSRHSRSRRTYTVTYMLTSHEFQTLWDFVEREIRGSALSFAWQYPYGSQLTSILNSTPNLVTMPYAHGFQTGDLIAIAETSSHNWQWFITRVSLTQFTLNGTTGSLSEETSGLVFPVYPFMSLQLENDVFNPAELDHNMGPLANDDGLARFTFTLREEFA